MVLLSTNILSLVMECALHLGSAFCLYIIYGHIFKYKELSWDELENNTSNVNDPV